MSESIGVLIEDGYNLEATIPGRGQRPPVRFTYRGALPLEVYRYLKASNATGEETIKKTIKLLLKHLVGWNIGRKNPGSDEPVSVPITEENLQRVPHDVLEKMVTHVIGYADEEAINDAKN